MDNLTGVFLSVLDALHKEKVDYVLIGGFAVVLHGSKRFTEDLDIFIKNTEENLTRLRTALHSVFHDKSIEEITVSEIDSYAVVRYGATDDFYLDIIGNLGEAFSYEDVLCQEIEVDGRVVRLATVESLYKLKEKTFRAIDQSDLLFLSEKIRSQKDGNGKEI